MLSDKTQNSDSDRAINYVGPFTQVFHRGEGSFWPCNAFSTPSSIELRACVQTHTNLK